MITTLNEFVKFCETATSDEIFDMFEDGCTEAVRDEVYARADNTSPEPFRSAMFNLGFTDF